MTATADRIESALLSMHATDKHCAVPSTVIRGSINLDGPTVSLAEVKSVCNDDPRFECAPNRKASFYLVPGASDETVQRAAIAVLDGCDEPLDYDTLASRTADMVRSLSSAGCGSYASPGRLAASIARAVNDERIFAVTVGATLGDSTFSGRRPAPVAPVADDMPSDDALDAAVRRALAVECSFAELFGALDRELFGGNADGMLDDMLDESLTRLIDAGVVETIDTPADVPGMLSRRTYALADSADPAPSIDLSDAFCDDDTHVVDADGFCVTCSRWSASAFETDPNAPDMTDADREQAANALCAVLVAVPDGMTFESLRSALGYRLGTVSGRDFAEILGSLVADGTVSRMVGGVYVASDDAPSAPVERVACCAEPCVRGGRCENCGTWLADLDDDARAVLANLSPPVASALPTDRESRVAASRAMQAALGCNRSSVRSTAKGTAAPFAGVVLSTEQAAHVAFKLRVLDVLLADGEPAVQDALASALSAATR